jgi:hypothetical protein
LEDLGRAGRIVLEWDLREIGWGGVDWIHVTQDKDQWQPVVNMVMNLQIT